MLGMKVNSNNQMLIKHAFYKIQNLKGKTYAKCVENRFINVGIYQDCSKNLQI